MAVFAFWFNPDFDYVEIEGRVYEVLPSGILVRAGSRLVNA